MTYSPGSPGYPPAQAGGSYAGGTPSFAKDDDATSKLPLYLTAAVAALGFLAYLASFGPMVTINAETGPAPAAEVSGAGVSLAVVAALLAGLLAAVSLVPKATSYVGVIGAVAVLGALLLISDMVNAGAGVAIGWGLWLVLVSSVLQAIVAVVSVLLESGVITAPAPRPKYDPYSQYSQYGQYGQYGQQAYYGQPGAQQHGGQQHSPQQSGYGPQYGAYQSGQGAVPPASTGGFAAQPGPQSAAQQQGTTTPPTGFPSFGPPPSGGASGAGSESGSAPANYSNQTGGEQAAGHEQQQSPSSPSGPPPA